MYVAITSQNILQAKQPGQLLWHPKHLGVQQPGFLQQQATGAREKGDAEPSRRWPHGGPQLPTLNYDCSHTRLWGSSPAGLASRQPQLNTPSLAPSSARHSKIESISCAGLQRSLSLTARCNQLCVPSSPPGAQRETLFLQQLNDRT